ncbi:MAG: cytochrome-c peroxidase [Nitrospinota bacterium]
MKNYYLKYISLFFISALFITSFPLQAMAAEIGPLPKMKNAPKNQAKVALGKRLFFDTRLSGDSAINCATCHDPKEGWTKHIAVGKAYPGSDHFRNAPTLINVGYKRQFRIPWHWDGRIGTNLNDMTRDQITDTYVMNLDMRIMQERIKQDAVYVKMFKDAGYGEPSNGKVRKAVPEFMKSIVSRNVPFDQGKLSGSAKKGQKLFEGKAGCVTCHNGPMFSDGKPHNTGVPENPCVFKDPMRHVTYLTYMFGMGTENRYNWRRDIGYLAVSHNKKDLGKFITPTLRELKYTEPYMHNGMVSSLDAVIDFYNKGGGPDRPGLKDPAMKPLNLSRGEKADLKAFLLSLSGSDPSMDVPQIPVSYEVIADWKNKKN